MANVPVVFVTAFRYSGSFIRIIGPAASSFPARGSSKSLSGKRRRRGRSSGKRTSRCSTQSRSPWQRPMGRRRRTSGLSRASRKPLDLVLRRLWWVATTCFSATKGRTATQRTERGAAARLISPKGRAAHGANRPAVQPAGARGKRRRIRRRIWGMCARFFVGSAVFCPLRPLAKDGGSDEEFGGCAPDGCRGNHAGGGVPEGAWNR